MDSNPHVKPRRDCASDIKHVGAQVIVASTLILLITLLAFVQIGSAPMGEIGHFTHDAALWVIPFAVWGVATGIGLMRTWRWARISMLVFGGLLTLFCAVPGVAFFLVPGGGIERWQALGLRVVGLLFLIPPALIVRWHMYFMRDEVRNCFHTSRRSPTASA